jgi:undecaprenyl-diphosphatase
MTVLEGLLLGVLQGLTEFLPVSSDGHLLLAKSLFPGAATPGHAFDVAVHFGTLLATIATFRRELRPLVLATPRLVAGLRSPRALLATYRADPAARYLVLFAVSAVPAGIVGIAFEDAVAAMNDRPEVLAPFFAITGFWLVMTLRVPAGERRVRILDAALLGVAQAAAILPAISRSGMTLGCGIFRRIERGAIGSFAFLMSIPPVAGAVALKAGDLGSGDAPLLPTAAGVVAAFLSGMVALRILLPFVHSGRLAWFGAYCIALAGFCFARFGGG